VAVRAGGLLAIGAFAAVYLTAFFLLDRGYDGVKLGLSAGLVMLALMWAVGLVIGLDCLGMLAFVVSLAMFSLPLRAAVGVLAAAVTACLVLTALAGQLEQRGYFAAIVFFVGLITGTIRYLEIRGAMYKELRQEAALANERERVARDVHDVLGHSLTVVAVKSELAQRLIDVDPDRAKAELESIRSLTREALGEIRATVAGLRVARLADELDAAREALAGAGIEASVPADASAVDPRHRIVLAWVLREAVTNVVRHSGAARCSVSLGPALLQVADDGRGLGSPPSSPSPPSPSSPEGNGLRGVRERVAAVGGRMTIGPGLDGRGLGLEVDLS